MAETTASATKHEGRLFIVRPSDRRLAVAWDERGGSEWQDLDDEGELNFVIIGRETSDEKCARLAVRYGLDAQGLIGFRDDDRIECGEVVRWGRRR